MTASAFCMLGYDEYVQDRCVRTVPLLQMCEARFYETIQVCSETSKDFQLVPKKAGTQSCKVMVVKRRKDLKQNKSQSVKKGL